MKLMKTVDAAGQVLCHDITRIIKGVEKGPVFRKGHIIKEEDIPVLLSVGKDHIYIWEYDESVLHENEAAIELFKICAGNSPMLIPSDDVKEGKVEIFAGCDGVFKVNREKLKKLNSMGNMMLACRQGNRTVKKGDKLAGTRIIPLVIDKTEMAKAEKEIGDEPIFSLVPFKKYKVGVVNTGNEVFYGRIEDTFTPVIKQKFAEFGSEICGRKVSPDDPEKEIEAIKELILEGCDLIVCTGGMSVDPDDKTPYAIGEVTGRDKVVTYGAPVLPGAMFLLAYYGEGNIPIMGLPGCVMYARRTIFDIVLPRVLTGEILEKKDIDNLGEGGICLDCPTCIFPNCGFGSGY